MRLVRAELKRAVARRVYRGLVLLIGVALLAAGTIGFFTSNRDDRASAEREAREIIADCERFRQSPEDECPSFDELAEGLSSSFDYDGSIPEATRVLSTALFALGMVLGASFLGAEFGTGSMSTLLTWEPARVRVLSAKAGAIALVAFVGAVVVLVVLALVFLPAGHWRGTVDVDGRWLRSLSWTWMRGGLLAVFGSLAGIAIATLTRNTAGAIGGLFAYLAVVDPLLGVVWSGRLEKWLLQYQIAQFIGFPVGDAARVLTPARPALLLTIYTAVLLAVAGTLFVRRDIT